MEFYFSQRVQAQHVNISRHVIVYLMVFNTLGFPVTQAHIGYDKNNLPIGLQVVTSPNNDHLSIAVGQAIQKIFGGWQEPHLLLEKSSDN
jgi:Asp-tRNA(Asn)/Glu-tRNA(Gln) amidotransferase A subunit family amidase